MYANVIEYSYKVLHESMRIQCREKSFLAGRMREGFEEGET